MKAVAFSFWSSIPAGWAILSLKHCVSRIATGGTPDTGTPEYWSSDGEGLPFVTIADMTRSDRIKRTERTLTRAGVKGRSLEILPKGTLLYSIYASLGKVAILEIEATVNQAILALVPASGVSREYLRWWLIYMEVFVQLLSNSNTQDNLSAQRVRRMPVILPPLREQVAIADFLDDRTARIDALIEKKERLLELLEEKRTALITRAITKGLDSNAPMKPSGIDWLGEIPAHWHCGPLYSRYEVALGKMLDAKQITGEHLAPYVRNVDVQWSDVNIDELPEMDFPPHQRERYRLRTGDLLVCEGGEVGRAAVWRGELDECFYQKAVHRVRPRTDGDLPGFLFYLIRFAAKAGVFTADGNPNTIDHLTAVKLKHYRFPFPPTDEQRWIAEELDREGTVLEQLENRVKEAIARVREYRSAIIASVVTGGKLVANGNANEFS